MIKLTLLVCRHRYKQTYRITVDRNGSKEGGTKVRGAGNKSVFKNSLSPLLLALFYQH